MPTTNSQSKKGPPNITSTANISEQSSNGRLSFAKKHQYTLALLVFLVIFAVASLYNLGYMSVQWDEMPHLVGATMLSHGQTWDYMTTYGYYPPIFDLVTTGYLQIFGATQIAGRLVAVTFSLLAIG